MGAAAVTAAQTIGYVGAGTVEFLLDTDGSFYFMEMNTRLQVEHPVTELITGLDLVAWQLQVAAGQSLPCRQSDACISGHAIEARLYAEDPSRDFLPSIGTLHHLQLPVETAQVRVDTGVAQGDEVRIYYDPMIAKIIVHDVDRPAALRRLRRALEQVEVAGVTTNAAFLHRVASHPAFAAANFDTGFIDKYQDELLPPAAAASGQTLALAALYLLLQRDLDARQAARRSSDPHAPWHQTSGWRLNGDNHHELCFSDGEHEHLIRVRYRPAGYLIEAAGQQLVASGCFTDQGRLKATLDGQQLDARVVRCGMELHVLYRATSHRLLLHDPHAEAFAHEENTGRLTAPMPGKIVALLVAGGARVTRGTPLIILEAMKMEHTITAPADGVVTQMNFAAGALVSDGAALLTFEADDGV